MQPDSHIVSQPFPRQVGVSSARYTAATGRMAPIALAIPIWRLHFSFCLGAEQISLAELSFLCAPRSTCDLQGVSGNPPHYEERNHKELLGTLSMCLTETGPEHILDC